MSSGSPEEKYPLLFTLPKSTTLLLIMYVTLLTVLIILSFKVKILDLKLSLALFGLGTLQIYLVKYIGSFTVPYSSVRRITSAEITALVPLLLVLMIKLISHQKMTFLYIVIAFTISFRFVVYYGAFFDKMSTSLLMSLLPSTPFFMVIRNPIDMVPILILVSSSLLLMLRLDNISKNGVGEKTSSLFKYFMSAWVSEYPFLLEKFLEKNAEKIYTKIYSIILRNEDSKPIRIVVPYIHPGPFKPVGSYNLPYEIKKNFLDENVIVVHAPVNHKFNIPSHTELRSLLNVMKKNGEKSSGTKIGMLKRIKSTNFEVLAIGILDNYKLIIINPTTPCEDFPSGFSEKFMKETGTIIIDAHNNLGPMPDESRIKEIENLVKKVTPDFEWKDELFVGYSHIEPWNLEDIGPGGADCITFFFKGAKKFSFIVFDANNARPGLVKRLVSDLEAEFGNTVILTTDSHFNAAKIATEKGYKALGEETPYHELLRTCKTLISLSMKNLKPVKIHLVEHKIEVKVIGENILFRLNKALEASLKFFKEFWILLLIMTFSLFFSLS